MDEESYIDYDLGDDDEDDSDSQYDSDLEDEITFVDENHQEEIHLNITNVVDVIAPLQPAVPQSPSTTTPPPPPPLPPSLPSPPNMRGNRGRGHGNAGRLHRRACRNAAGNQEVLVAQQRETVAPRVHSRGRGRGQVQQDIPNSYNQEDLSWKWEIENEADAPDLNIPFTENFGLKVRMNSQDPIDFFLLYWTDELFQFIVVETNRYADQYIMSRNDNDSNDSYVDT